MYSYIDCCDGPSRHIRYSTNANEKGHFPERFHTANELKKWLGLNLKYNRVYNLDIKEEQYCPFIHLNPVERVKCCEADLCGKANIDTFNPEEYPDSGCQFKDELNEWLWWNGPDKKGPIGDAGKQKRSDKKLTVQKWLGNDFAIEIWEKKYRRNNESLDQWFERVSGGDSQIKRLIREKKFLFGGRTLANRGIPDSGSFFNCYSNGYCPDDLGGIMDCAKELCMTYKHHGGNGVSLSKVRPKGASIRGLYTSDGIAPIMKIFNQVTESVSQGGSRKGALMISIDMRHRDAEQFITIKDDLNQINCANLSLEIDDKFMQAVDSYYKTGNCPILEEKRTYGGRTIHYSVNVVKLYNALCAAAWKQGEPGVLFVDEMRNYNMLEFDDEYEIVSTNPCGEQPLGAKMCCALSSFNLSQYVISPFTPEAHFDYDSFLTDIPSVVRAMDDLIDENKDRHALPEQKEMSLKYRNIGIGVMGYSDALIKLGLTYGTEEALKFTNTLFKLMAQNCYLASQFLAQERGSYPAFKPELIAKSRYFQNLGLGAVPFALRNATLISIAPTGSLSQLFNGGVAGGIEPHFALSYTRKTESIGEAYHTINCGSLELFRQLKGENTKIPSYFTTSKQIPWRDRIATQAAIQKWVDTGISSTINLPENTTVEEVEQLYLEAWKARLKGVTIFRDNCFRAPILSDIKNMKLEVITKDGQKTEIKPIEDVPRMKEVAAKPIKFNGVGAQETTAETEAKQLTQFSPSPTVTLSTAVAAKGNATKQCGGDCGGCSCDKGLKRGEILPVSDQLTGLKRKIRTGCGTLHTCLYFDPETKKATELYLSKGSEGSCNSLLSTVSRLVSLALRGGISLEDVCDQLVSTLVCPSFSARKATKHDVSPGSSCGSAVAYALESMASDFVNDTRFVEIAKGKNEIVKNLTKPSFSEQLGVQEKLPNSTSNPNLVEDLKNKIKLVANDPSQCPDCGAPLLHEGGCLSCSRCSFSKC